MRLSLPSIRLGDRINIGWKLTSVSKLQGGSEQGFLLTYDTPAGEKQLKACTVLLTVPAYTAADMLKSISVSESAPTQGSRVCEALLMTQCLRTLLQTC